MYIRHLLKTDRLNTAYYCSGAGNAKKLLLIHGNLSSSAFYLPLFPMLEQKYEIVAPDLRGFGDSQTLPVDATRGYRDWSDDIYAFVRSIGWSSFEVCGWSMGGNIAMQLAIDHTELIERLVLIAPAPPCGFGGTYGDDGKMFDPPGLGSGGGCANPMLVSLASIGSRTFLREILKEYYFKPPFRMSWSWENLLISEIAKTRIGKENYPGDYTHSPKWPHVVAGTHGVLNAMSPLYGNLSAMLSLEKKPPVLWIRGADDLVVSDNSMMEFGNLGKQGAVYGWPGEEEYPPQPMIAQTRRFFKEYARRGGYCRETVIPGGHMCVLEHPEALLKALEAKMKTKATQHNSGA